MIFERRPGIPLTDAALNKDAFDLLLDDYDDDYDAFDPASSPPDVPLLHADSIPLDELQALHTDRVEHDLLSDADDDTITYSSSDSEEKRSDSEDDSDSDDDDDSIDDDVSIVTTDHMLPRSQQEDKTDTNYNSNQDDSGALVDEPEDMSRGVSTNEPGAPVDNIDHNNASHKYNLRDRSQVGNNNMFNEQFDPPVTNRIYEIDLKSETIICSMNNLITRQFKKYSSFKKT